VDAIRNKPTAGTMGLSDSLEDGYMSNLGIPNAQGLYNPENEHDSCGVGFVVNMKGKASHDLVVKALTILTNLEHRGACGCEVNTGDGAGILLQTPDKFLRRVCADEGVTLPRPRHYGVGMVFLPRDPATRALCEATFERIVREENQTVLGWRTVPTNNESVGKSARKCEPFVRQVFIGRNPDLATDMDFERKLFIIRSIVTRQAQIHIPGDDQFYILSLSYKTIVYKGMLTTGQAEQYYPELADPDMETALALVHSRFSTNTFPSWDRAHPYRYVAHNGEINTIRGNENWMHARQAHFESDLFGDDLKNALPIINPNSSDSGRFDNVLEFLVLSGYALPHAVMMMVPEPWANHESMSDEKKAFYQFNGCMMEPWDGPASIAFTDGIRIGAVLDRNGLRPSRFYVTKDDLVIMASEVGVLSVPPDQVLQKGRLQPGRMFLVDTEEGRIIADEEIKSRFANAKPYRQWLSDNLVQLASLPDAPVLPASNDITSLQLKRAFGYTFEELRMLMTPMARDGVEATGSMGNDAPLAVLSERPQLLFNYFKQLFAQVTNPPIDCIREEIIMSSDTTIGTEGNLLKPGPDCCRLINAASPILTNEELAKLRHIDRPYFRSITVPILFDVDEGEAGLAKAMNHVFATVDQAIKDGINIIILSDAGLDKDHAPIPSLLAVAGVHHHTIRKGTRTRIGLVIETGEAREIHHFSLLIGYGAAAINPYLAFHAIGDMIQEGLLPDMTQKEAVKNYVKAAVKGVMKVISKMGISTIQSYCGAQIFEAIGIKQDVIDRFFTWTASRIGGIGLEGIAREALERHQSAFSEHPSDLHALESGGQYQWRADGEAHLFSPLTIHKLQQAVRTGDYQAYKDYAALVNEQLEQRCTLRSLLEFKDRESVPLEEVEPWTEIVKRFKTGAMSYGSISKEAHESLAIAMNRIDGKSNTGEGGEDPERYVPDADGSSRKSRIKQVASGRFGVTSQYLVSADEIQIKMAQGAKPGEGGQLPGQKVYPWIAKTRHSTPGVGLISPPPHHDIYSIEDLAELIHDLKNGNRHARISVKLVSEVGVGTIAAGVAKAKADVVLISGYDGGTGSSPQTSIKHAGLPWELGLAETHQTLVLNNLRSRIRVETDGQLKTGRDVAVATLLGAEEFGFSTAPLVALGCIMMRKCHLNTCPAGIATQNPRLREKFAGDPEHVINFMRFVAEELREIMAELGFRTVSEMVGRTDKLEMTRAISHWKAKGIDLSPILTTPEHGPEVGVYCSESQDHGLDRSLDIRVLLDLCKPALEHGEKVRADLPIVNTNRVVGTILGSEITRKYGGEGLPEDTIVLRFEGSAGQSFGAFVPAGVTLELEGDSNDYIGKGLSGGKIIVKTPRAATFSPEENIIVGNVAFYGATSGSAYVNGVAGERFCVRNSGINAVVEGVGDHGCEYMTGGRAVIIGKTGRNFAAGMSGGIAYVLDEVGDFPTRCNKQTVSLEQFENLAEAEEIRQLVRLHAEHTGSRRGRYVLENWTELAPKFVKVIPKDYKRMVAAIERAKQSGLTGDEALMSAFEDNAKDVARVTGN
jgi:glutamate synthase (ferredoxin)